MMKGREVMAKRVEDGIGREIIFGGEERKENSHQTIKIVHKKS